MVEMHVELVDPRKLHPPTATTGVLKRTNRVVPFATHPTRGAKHHFLGFRDPPFFSCSVGFLWWTWWWW